jgi:AAHS family 4-hydroxybenzoate transporter-like MFS transporter
MTVMFLGFPMGAILGGLVSVYLIDGSGWQSIFVLGGIMPLAIAALMYLALPESLRWLAQHGENVKALDRYLAKMDALPAVRPASLERAVVALDDEGMCGPLAHAELRKTLALWLLFFANFLALYTLITWLPTLIEALGYPIATGIRASVLFNLGGMAGGLCVAGLIDRHGAVPVLKFAYLIAAVLVVLFAVLKPGHHLLMVCLFILGAPIAGAPFGVSALAVSAYATRYRARGLGWALAVGRLGAVAGPVMVGFLLVSAGVWGVLYLLVIPVMLCMLSLILFDRTVTRPT